jgi:DNA-binding transcriptional ArsR family regulator
MSGKAVGWAFEQRGLTSGQKLVLLGLADHADDEGVCWPGRRKLAEKCDLTERSVTRALADLEAAKLVERTAKFGESGVQAGVIYRLSIGATPVSPQGDASVPGRATPVSPKPSIEPSVVKEEKERAVGEVFSHWQGVFGKYRSRLSPQRRKKIEARLKEGFSVDQLKRAVDGCAGSDFHRDNGHVDLTLICRSEEKLEFFLALYEPPEDEEDFFAGTGFES